MKILLICALVLTVIAVTPTSSLSQSQISIEYGTLYDIKPMSKLFVLADDEDLRTSIIRMLRGYEGIQVVNSTKEADAFLEYSVLTRDVAANRGPRAMGASMALKSQMQAYVIKPDGTKRIAWTETETYNVSNGFVMGAPNQVNLTHHFVRDLQETRGEKPYSIRKLMKNKPKPTTPE